MSPIQNLIERSRTLSWKETYMTPLSRRCSRLRFLCISVSIPRFEVASVWPISAYKVVWCHNKFPFTPCMLNRCACWNLWAIFERFCGVIDFFLYLYYNVYVLRTDLCHVHEGLVDCASECRKYSLFTGEGSWLQLHPRSQVFGSKDLCPFSLSYFNIYDTMVLPYIYHTGKDNCCLGFDHVLFIFCRLMLILVLPLWQMEFWGLWLA